MNSPKVLTYEEFFSDIMNLQQAYYNSKKPFLDLELGNKIGFSFFNKQLTLHLNDILDEPKNSIIIIDRKEIQYPNLGKINQSLVSIDHSVVTDFDYLISIYYYMYKKFVYGEDINSILSKLSDFLHNFGTDSTFLQGLVGELIFILSQQNKIELIDAWHTDPTNTFDFYSNSCKFEVKTTSKAFRVHKLSSDQILKSENVYLCSVMLNVSEDYFTVSELIDMIIKGSNIPISSIEILKKKVNNSIKGKAISINTKIFYDIDYSLSNISFYDIPKNDIFNSYPYIKKYGVEIDFTNFQKKYINKLEKNYSSPFLNRSNKKSIPGIGDVIQQ